MSILTAIFQAIGQALTWIFPISESGHSAIFHIFSGRFTNACSQLTGVIHIGIAVGILIAFFKMFIKLFSEFFRGWNELFHKRLDVKGSSPFRSFMYMTILSFAMLILYVIPAGKHGNLFMLLHRASYNETLLGEGICFALTGLLIYVTSGRLNAKINPLPRPVQALLIGFIAMLAIPTAGCSLVAGVFCIAVLSGMSYKIAYRYSMVMSVMVLIVAGITELCIAVTPVKILPAIIALVISAACSFLFVRLFTYVIKNRMLKYIGWYDLALGVICLVVGIFQIIIK